MTYAYMLEGSTHRLRSMPVERRIPGTDSELGDHVSLHAGTRDGTRDGRVYLSLSAVECVGQGRSRHDQVAATPSLVLAMPVETAARTAAQLVTALADVIGGDDQIAEIARHLEEWQRRITDGEV